MNNSILVTGATGFVGRRLLQRVIDLEGFEVVAAVRRAAVLESMVFSKKIKTIEISGLEPDADWEHALAGIDTIIHTAARAHIMDDRAADPLAEFRKVNVDGTLNLARQAVAVGVRRFIFISSIKVNGELTRPGAPFAAEDTPAPEDPYGISKMEAEEGLQQLAAEAGMEVVVIRPPLVYGPGVKGNFASMIKLVAKGYPLPFGAIRNQRSLVALDNLIDLIVTCIDHPQAANQVFLAADGEDLSTTELLQRVAGAMAKSSKLIAVPSGLLQVGATLLGKRAVAQRLLGSLQVDISKTQHLLGWNPPISVDEGLRRCFERV